MTQKSRILIVEDEQKLAKLAADYLVRVLKVANRPER